jgi:hypothetical protein
VIRAPNITGIFLSGGNVGIGTDRPVDYYWVILDDTPVNLRDDQVEKNSWI